jgi:hypothetical protein
LFQIDNSNGNTPASTLPTPAIAGTPGYFAPFNPLLSQEGTVLTPDWANMLQSEIINVVTAAGLTPSKTTFTQLLQALQGLTRIKLTAPLNLYVATTGSDSNPGTISAPFLTIQHAWNYLIGSIDANEFSITINVANGTYTTGLSASGKIVGGGAGGVNVIGNPSSPSSVVINVTNAAGFIASDGSILFVSGFTIIASGSAGDFSNAGFGLLANIGSVISFNQIVFGACGTAHICASAGGFISTSQSGATYSVSGNAPNHVFVEDGGVAAIVDGTCTLISTPAFTTFAQSFYCSILQIYNMTFVGSATGIRYITVSNGVINTNGAGATYLPGNSGGSSLTGGQYT